MEYIILIANIFIYKKNKMDALYCRLLEMSNHFKKIIDFNIVTIITNLVNIPK